MKYTAIFVKLNVYITLNLHYFLIMFDPNLMLQSSYFEIEKCPKCYGTDLCKFLLTDSYISKVKIVDIFSLFFSVKNVIFCEYLNQKIVLKKLGSSQDLSHLDTLPNESLDHIRSQNIKKKIKKSLSFNENKFDLQICPSVNKFEYIVDQIRFQQNISINSSEYYAFLYNMYIILQINPEPIILQILNNAEYPIPKFLGFCGRVSVQMYMGKTMTKFYFSDWKIRANITLQILDAAHVFTFKHKDFRIYLLDISMDNIVVSNTGKISYIDLEHVLLLDKNSEVNTKEWYDNHISEIIKCESKNCFAYSPMDICSHYLSDHNIYMTCEMLLNETTNFLHGIPEKIKKMFPNVTEMLQNCVDPFRKKIVQSRFSISKDIIKVLKESIRILS